MIRNHPGSHGFLLARAVGNSRKRTEGIDERTEEIRFEVRLHLLHHRSETLEAHAGIDILLGKRMQLPRFVPVELHEHQIPNFEIPIAAASHGAIRRSAGKSLSLVVDQLRTGAARPYRAHGPEIIFLSQADDMIFRKPHILVPDGKGVVVIQIDGGVEAVRIQPYVLREKGPGPGNGLPFEIISKAEIPQHFEKGMMPGGTSHVVDVVGANTFLRRGGPKNLGGPDTQKVRFEGNHAGDGKKDGRILRKQRKAGITFRSLLLEILQKHFPQFVAATPFHNSIRPPPGNTHIIFRYQGSSIYDPPGKYGNSSHFPLRRTQENSTGNLRFFTRPLQASTSSFRHRRAWESRFSLSMEEPYFPQIQRPLTMVASTSALLPA